MQLYPDFMTFPFTSSLLYARAWIGTVLNEILLDEVRKSFKRTSRTCHTLLLGGGNPPIFVGIFDFFFVFLLVCVVCARAFDVLG